MMLVEADVTTGVLLLMVWTLVVAMVPVAGVIIAAAVVVSLAGSLVCVGAIAARPVAESDVADREEEAAGFWTAEEPMALIGTVAHPFSYR